MAKPQIQQIEPNQPSIKPASNSIAQQNQCESVQQMIKLFPKYADKIQSNEVTLPMSPKVPAYQTHESLPSKFGFTVQNK